MIGERQPGIGDEECVGGHAEGDARRVTILGGINCVIVRIGDHRDGGIAAWCSIALNHRDECLGQRDDTARSSEGDAVHLPGDPACDWAAVRRAILRLQIVRLKDDQRAEQTRRN